MVISYSFVNDYVNCPRKAYHKYVLRDLPKEDTHALRHGYVLHKIMEDAINQNKEVPKEYAPYEKYLRAIRTLQTVKAEVKVAADSNGVACGYYSKEVAFRGKVDVLITTPDEAVLVDWKTGKVREDPYELEVQASLVSINNPTISCISGYYVWLAEGRVGKRFPLNKVADTFKNLQRIREEAMLRATWEPKPNPLCGWCPLLSCEFNRRPK
jgi:CRISPR/Cas system-associated exonuclease Cas4 (RecB family)